MAFRRILSLFLLVLWLAVPARARAARPTTRPVPQITRAVLISIDGCRPDLVLRADTPTLHQMMREGSYSFWARTTAESVTLPSHTSMLTGVVPIKHQVQWNKDLPLERPVYPMYPTLFELAKRAGYTTAMVAGKSKFVSLAQPGTLDWVYVPDVEKDGDDAVTDRAVTMIEQHRPDVLFVHLPSVDNVGHAFGWATPQQILAIENADACVGRVRAALAAQGLLGSTFVLVTSDHGGAGKSHGPDDARSRHIPWIAAGPGIRRGLDLTTYGDLVIDTEDSFCTICDLLATPVPRPVDGKPVTEIIDRAGQELLHASAAGN